MQVSSASVVSTTYGSYLLLLFICASIFKDPKFSIIKNIDIICIAPDHCIIELWFVYRSSRFFKKGIYSYTLCSQRIHCSKMPFLGSSWKLIVTQWSNQLFDWSDSVHPWHLDQTFQGQVISVWHWWTWHATSGDKKSPLY